MGHLGFSQRHRASPAPADNVPAQSALRRPDGVGNLGSHVHARPSQIPVWARNVPGPPGYVGLLTEPEPLQMSPLFHISRFPIQAKRGVGKVGDRLEHEAGTVAEGLMRLPAASISVAAAPPQIGRKYSTRGGEGEMSAQSDAAADAPSIVHEVLRSPGKPLDGQARALMEPRFGRDFSRVRIHADAAAARSAKEIHARAYTAGNNVVFASGQFSPRSPEGQTLLAHELTHVVQQGGEARLIQRAPTYAQTNEPTGPQVSQKPDPSAKNSVPSLSADDWIWVLETLRRGAPQEFVKVLAEKEGLFYPILEPYGFRGSWVKEEAYLDDFDAAVRKWGKSRIYSRKFGFLSQIAPPAKEKSREERQYQEAQWLVIDMNRRGYGRGNVNDALESAGLLDDLESHGFEKVAAYSFTPSVTYQKRAVDALNQYIDRYRNAHNIKVQTSIDVPAQAEDIEFYRAWLEGLSYITSSFGAAAAAHVASIFTDDPEKITAAAGLGAAFEGAIGAMAGGRGSYSPEVVGPRGRPGAIGAWRYTGEQPIKTAVDPAKVGAPPTPGLTPPPPPAPTTSSSVGHASSEVITTNPHPEASTPTPRGGQRSPILADTDVLIQAFNGNPSALAEIRAGKTYITSVQYYEFMAQQAIPRQDFLIAEGIEVKSLGPPAPTLARAGGFYSLYSSVASAHGYGDAVLVTYGRLMGLDVVTMESRLGNFIRETLHIRGIRIRQLPGAR
jgi:hypothetical protein